jgi:hypothetical protein
MADWGDRTDLKEKQRIVDAGELNGRATGVLFLAGFGTLWMGLALYAMQVLDLADGGAILGGLLTLVAGAAWLMQRARQLPRKPADPAMRRAFRRINAIQWIAVFVAAFFLPKLHLERYVVTAIAVIVGLHMFPLARLFRHPQHYVTGAVLVIGAVATASVASRRCGTEHYSYGNRRNAVGKRRSNADTGPQSHAELACRDANVKEANIRPARWLRSIPMGEWSATVPLC